jgi:hypothetical protein
MIEKVGLNSDTVRIELSNAKPNIALSVRILQCPKDSYLDLISLIPLHATTPEDIPQTLVYSNFCIEVVKDKISDAIGNTERTRAKKSRKAHGIEDATTWGWLRRLFHQA